MAFRSGWDNLERQQNGIQPFVGTKMIKRTNNDPREPPLRVAKLLQSLRHGYKDLRRKREIKESILLFFVKTNLFQSLLQSLKRFVATLMTRNVAASLTELFQLLGVSWTFELDRRSDDFDEFIVADLVWGKTDNFEVRWEETSLLL